MSHGRYHSRDTHGLVDRSAASTWMIDEHLGGLSPACVAADPGSPAQVYCGTAHDGLFRSRDSGRNWEPVGPGIDQPMITAVDVGHAGQADAAPADFEGATPITLECGQLRWSASDAGQTNIQLRSITF